MKVGILTIGNELMNGRTADTNSAFIAREINLQGWQVEAVMSAQPAGYWWEQRSG